MLRTLIMTIITCCQVLAADALLVVRVYSTNLGVVLDNAKLDLVSIGSKKNFSSAFSDYKAYVPAGTYRLRVTAPGLKAHEQTILVDEPSTTIRVGLTAGDIEHLKFGLSRPTIGMVSGRVSWSGETERDLWLQAYPVFGPAQEAQIVNIDADGRFEMSVPLGLGTWLLVVVETFSEPLERLPKSERYVFPRVVGTTVIHPSAKPLEVELKLD
jgi:hypothetical protein